ncbi:hypothetical protein [Trichloromonas sp.]|uniref:hypothetical protein n=1 Tax=Trichloromonas sp. TaxID=3069249 RepID=UPI002A394911|nr:hypothetical protein [Trichloromonas sp.]
MSSAANLTDSCLNRDSYRLAGLDDEIRADQLCHELLRHCYLHLVEKHDLTAEEASHLCYGVSYFLCEYLIPEARINPFDLGARDVRRFAGHWYIIRNMEPNLIELTGILEGILAFAAFCRDRELMTDEQIAAIETACAELDYYRERINSFWAIEKEGYDAWRAACPLRD